MPESVAAVGTVAAMLDNLSRRQRLFLVFFYGILLALELASMSILLAIAFWGQR